MFAAASSATTLWQAISCIYVGLCVDWVIFLLCIYVYANCESFLFVLSNDFCSLFQLFRLSRLREIKPFDGWVALNWLVQIIFITAIIYFFGAKSFVYLLSFLFFVMG